MTRKAEVQHLREKVKIMDAQLVELKKKVSHEKTAIIHHCELAPPLWKDIATRQKLQYQITATNNAKLRAKLKSQLRIAKTLMHAIHRGKSELSNDSLNQVQRPVPNPKRNVQRCVQPLNRNEFAELLTSMEDLFISTNDSMHSAATASLAFPHICDAQVNHNIQNGDYLEFQDSRFLPFTLETVNRAMWRFLRDIDISSSHYNVERREEHGDTILRTYAVKLDKKSGIANLQGKQSMRRYFRGNSVVIVRKSIISTMGDSDDSNVAFVECGWIVLMAVPGQRATLTQELSTISSKGPDPVGGMITNSMIAARRQIVDKAFQVLENILFEEARRLDH
ncbi:hypothetical protein PHMEG_00028594 [Phytophthora megakarya]|uniref:M96 mating-specific protein n=1 Tax=Phytophthora megakarya TaxID=4795 RepID=A0A225V4M9_9STRA|nr:hypothetical protein PHMEG_00028594 [Phytophthora megakarya]